MREIICLVLVFLVLGYSGFSLVPNTATCWTINEAVPDSVVERAGVDCLRASIRVPGVDGAFSVVDTDDAGGVYVAYQSQWTEDGSESSLHVYFAHSHDYGKTWSESFRVDDDGSLSVYCDSPSIAVDRQTGHIFVAWKDDRTGVAKVYIDKSVDHGVSFGSDVLVYDWPNDYVETWLPRTVKVEVGDDGKVYVAWIAYYSDSFTDCDIFFASSADDGQTFSAPTDVSLREGAARLAHPWITIDGEDAIYVAYARRNSTFSGVYVAKSQDGGLSFGTPVKVNDDSTRRYRGGTQVVASQDGRIHVVWTDGRAGDGSQYLDIYYAVSLDGGLSFEPNVRVNDDLVIVPPPPGGVFTRGAQGTPSIVTDSGARVHVVWEDFRNFVNETGYCRDVYYAFSEDGTQFSKNVQINYVSPNAASVNCADPNMAIDCKDNLFITYSDAPSGDNEHHQIYFMFARARTLVDIHPETLNLRSRGRWVTAFIELPIGFNAKDVDVSTILLNWIIPAELHPSRIKGCKSGGTQTLMVKFDREAVIQYILSKVTHEKKFMTVTLALTGKLNDGTPFQGSDTIKITMCPNHHDHHQVFHHNNHNHNQHRKLCPHA